jgi:hypothetical protein
MINNRLSKNYEYVLLLLILIVGSWLRFHNLSVTSFSNDELSALTRARYDSFHELIEQGIKTDGHPALVETMMWFVIHHFNDNVFTVRFLFALSGIVSILFIFLLAKRWFGSATALLSAAALATLQFPLLYSQLARPYSIGLMFTLAMAYFWTELLWPHPPTTSSKEMGRTAAAYILCAVACMYTHYFSLLMAAIIGVSGLFFLNKENFKRSLVSNFIVVLLFIPHLSITRFQFAYGGLGWLSVPKSNFLSLFISYGFNDSKLIFYLFIGILLMSVIARRNDEAIPRSGLRGWGLLRFARNDKWKKFHSLSVLWYLIPFVVGYYYSTLKAPILQYSVLLFSFPFILIFIFSFIKDEWINKTFLTLFTLIILATGTYSTVIENKYYTAHHFGVFKELAQKDVEWNNKLGKENITTSFTLSNPEYLNYYFRKQNAQPNQFFYTDDERNNFGRLSQLLDSTKTEYFAYGWTNWDHQYETVELIQERFPIVAENDTFFNSQITLFKKGDNANIERIIAENDFEKDNWDKETEKQSKDFYHSGLSSQKMDAQTEYSSTFKSTTEKLNLQPDEMLKAEVWFNAPDSVGDATLVITFSKNGETILWQGMPLKYFYNEKNKWPRAILCSPVVNEPNSELAVYIWNKDKKTFYVDDFKITVAKKNPIYHAN